MTDSMNNVFDSPADWSKIEVSFDLIKQFQGGFFPYLKKTNLDLSAYGIFNHLDYNNYRTNCFIQAIEKSHVFTADEILLIRGSMNNRLTRVEDIQQIADMFNVVITIRFGSDDNDKTSFKKIEPKSPGLNQDTDSDFIYEPLHAEYPDKDN